ncbi:MBG domain-containing protein [Chitinophaga sp. YIM B06452]|uniref:MBG domain-containing protein n=1 Tax=Chitinophaga sp. YIM B06452 TaxID=3082158 RepID=UPI0031FF1021
MKYKWLPIGVFLCTLLLCRYSYTKAFDGLKDPVTGRLMFATPTILAINYSNLGANSITLGGNITGDGGSPVTERGIVWGTASGVTMADNVVVMGSGTGTFSQIVTGLPANTVIYYRSYATNAEGTSYTVESQFQTNWPLNGNTTRTNVSCPGGSNGTVTAYVYPNSGKEPFTYSWSPVGSTSSTVTGLSAGVYTCTITDAEGATKDVSATVTQPNPANITTPFITNVTCNGGSNGKVQLVMSGGTSPYTYLWSANAGSQTTNQAINLSADTYSCTVTDANGCIYTKTGIVVTQPAPVTAGTMKMDVACYGGATGEARILSVSGGFSPYSYLWTNGATTASVTGLTAGTNISCTISDVRGCSVTKSFTISQPATPLAINFPKTDVSCYGGSNGTARAQVSGGAGAYTYQWSNSRTAALINNLTPGTYTCTATDANGCTVTGSVTISQPAAPLSAEQSYSNVSCHSGSNGSAVVIPSDGTGPYTYLWTNGYAAGQIAVGLPAGPISCTITDANGCTVTKSFTINEPPVLTATTGQTDVSCNGGSNGSASVTPSGGTAGYTYAWSNGGTTAAINGLTAGTYTCTIEDANSCTITKTVTINQPVALTATSSAVTDVTCYGYTNGSATASVSGGTSPYTYAWSDGSTAAIISNVGAGTYSCVVTDNNGCTANLSATISQPAELIVTPSVTNVACFGGTNGAASLAHTGGTTPFTYQWSTGAATSAITSKAAGNYTYSVTDNNGCVASGPVTITEPTALAATTGQVDVSCNGGSNGSASVTPSGGTIPYSYSWSNGGTSATINGLAAGTYTCTITDNNGCTLLKTVTVGQPVALAATSSGVTDATCFGYTNGSAAASVNGGTSPYTYAWSNGATGATISNVGAATYTCVVTDNKGCTANLSATVSQPAALSATPNVTNVSCFGGTNGGASLAPSGGTAPYNYLWSNGATASAITNVAAGNYTYNVTDNNGCTASGPFTISEPTMLAATTGKVDVSCNGGSNGSASVNPSGGTTPYAYVWSNGGTAATINGLTAGTYTCTITDANGCTLSKTVTVGQPVALAATSSAVTDAACYGYTNGSAAASVSGGTAPYTYAWSNGNTSATISNVGAGVYTCVVTDNNGCTANFSATISQPAALAVSKTVTDVSCFGGTNGAASLTPSGGTAPYSYTWSNGTAANAIANVAAGNYTYNVTDNNGCAASGPVTVSAPAALVLNTSQTSVSCTGGNNGTASVIASGGTAPYAYLWNNGRTTATINGLVAGTFTCTVTDANGCVKTGTVTVNELPALVAVTGQVSVSCHGGSDGAASVAMSGGTAPYTYVWSNGGTAATINGLTAGTYTCTISDANSCVQTATVTVNELPALVATTGQVNVGCHGGSSGSASVNASGGTAPYAYSWSNGGITPAINGLAAGTYTCVIKDANNCSVTKTVTLTEPVALSASGGATTPDCAGGSNGSASITATGGTAPYVYLWSNGGTTATVNGLAAGTYTCTITDANGCTLTETVTVNAPVPLTVTVSSVVNVTCYGGNNGGATASASGGTAPYTYAWSNGSTVAALGNVIAGAYTCIVTDNKGCTASSSLTISQPAALFAVMNATGVSCADGSNGSASVAISGGTAPYTYLWNNGGTTASITGLAAGTYTVAIKDANNCAITGTVTVTAPAAITGVVSAQTNVLCKGGNTGSATIAASGGTGAYTYSWAPGGGNTASISNLAAGTYTCTITDANDCTGTVSVTITEPAAAVSATISQTPALCNGGSTGSASVLASGGTAPYAYTWSAGGNNGTTLNNLAAGNYSCVITDVNNCSLTKNFTITQPAQITATITKTDVTTQGGSNGTATVTASGGTGMLTYVWAPSGGNSASATGLAAGVYTCTVKDANNCSIIQTVTIHAPSSLGGFPAMTKSYGDASFTLPQPASTGTGAFTYSSDNAAVASVSGNTVTIIKPGVANITATQAADATHTAASITSTLTVSPKTITATLLATPAISKTYDGNNMATVAAANYQLNGVVGSDAVAVSGAAAQYDTKNAGAGKTITVTGLALSGAQKDNYQLAATSATTAGIIKPKVLTATAAPVTKVYDGSTSAAVTFNNLSAANGLVGTDVVQVQYIAAVYASKNVNTPPAKIPVTVTGLELAGADKGNYMLNGVTVSGDITQRSVTVTADPGQKVMYGNALPQFTYTVTTGSLVPGDAFTGQVSKQAGNNAGLYDLLVSGLTAGPNYNVTFVSNKFEITKRPLTITADDKQIVLGAAIPALTVSYSGFANTENASVLTTQPTVSTTATAASPEGDYPINATGATAANYDISYVKGTLHIRKATGPTDISLAAGDFYENRPIGSSSAKLTTATADPGAAFTYTLAAGAGDADNSFFTIDNDLVRNATVLDYELHPVFNIRVRATDQNGLWIEKALTLSARDVNEVPAITAITDQSVCPGAASQKIDIAMTAGEETQQTVAATISADKPFFTDLSISATAIHYTLKADAAGEVTVRVRVQDNGGTANEGVDTLIRTFKINVASGVDFTIQSNKGPQFRLGENITLTVRGAARYEWTVPANVTDSQVVVTPTRSTTYVVKGFSNSGCSLEKSFTVEVTEDAFHATNIITPNGDGYNDRWLISNIHRYPGNKVEIVNRNGKVVYTRNDYNNEWDGKLNGVPLPEGNYYYIVNLGDGSPVRKGYISIVLDKK